MAILLREAIGDRLRHARTIRRRTLRDISRVARVSLGYLSEVERGQKEASSELLASICDALELPMSELMTTVASDIGTMERVESVDTVQVELPEVPLTGQRADPRSAVPGRSGSLEGGRLLASMVGAERSDRSISASLPHGFTTSISAGGVTVAA
ncbi:MAG: helix-turn-helix domain-containing protein [Sciscionella sp.]